MVVSGSTHQFSLKSNCSPQLNHFTSAQVRNQEIFKIYQEENSCDFIGAGEGSAKFEKRLQREARYFELQMAHNQNQYQHWSGYSIEPLYNSTGNALSSGYPSRRSPARSPMPIPCISPSPPKSLSSSPREHKDSHHSAAHSGSLPGSTGSSGGHSSRKLDSIFRHLVKWSSPHKDKDKKHHETLSTSPPSTGEYSSPRKGSLGSSRPIAVDSHLRSHHHHNYYSDYCRARAGSTGGRRRLSSDSYDGEEEPEAELDEEALSDALLPVSRLRSKSLDIDTTRKYLRNRRLSGDIQSRVKDSSQTHHTYTIYESIIQEGGSLFESVCILQCILALCHRKGFTLTGIMNFAVLSANYTVVSTW